MEVVHFVVSGREESSAVAYMSFLPAALSFEIPSNFSSGVGFLLENVLLIDFSCLTDMLYVWELAVQANLSCTKWD